MTTETKNNKKNIWIINDYAGCPKYGMEYRNYYLSKELVKKGHSITIISSAYSHLFRSFPKEKKENIDGINYLWLKTLNYGNSHSRKRILKWFIFTLKSFFIPFSIKNRPDIIIVSPMAPFPILPGWFLSKIFKTKLIYEVTDIWPLSIVELGGFSPENPFIRFMAFFEKFALKKSHFIISNLQNYGKHIKELGIKRDFTWISNGVDLEEMQKIEALPENIEKLIPKNKFVVGYTGTIGVANALDSFLNAAELINNTDIAFVLVGSGQEKDKLKEKYKSNKNIIFIDAVKKQEVQSVLKYFNVCFLGWNKEKLYEFGTSANKLFDYMYSGKPVLNAYSGKGDLVQICKCGISVEAENSISIAEGITKLYKMTKKEREKLGENGKEYVLKHFTYEKLAEKLETIFFLCG